MSERERKSKMSNRYTSSLSEGLQGIVLLLRVLAVIVVARSSGTMTLEGYSIMSLPNLVLIFQCGRPSSPAIVTHL
jgi:hypothetical protein